MSLFVPLQDDVRAWHDLKIFEIYSNVQCIAIVMQSCAFFVQQSTHPITEQPELRKLSHFILASFSSYQHWHFLSTQGKQFNTCKNKVKSEWNALPILKTYSKACVRLKVHKGTGMAGKSQYSRWSRDWKQNLVRAHPVDPNWTFSSKHGATRKKPQVLQTHINGRFCWWRLPV